jgi:hypothetical protein
MRTIIRHAAPVLCTPGRFNISEENMPQRRKSAEVHRLTGTYRKDRHGPVPQPDEEPLGLPKGLPAEVRRAWRDIAASGEGRLTAADAVLVEAAARSLARVRSPEAKAADYSNLIRASMALGLDPVHRRPIEKRDAYTPFDEF